MEIPKTLEECYLELDKINDVDEWLKLPEQSAIAQAHHGLGKWIRNNWGLWTGENDLCKWFNSNEIKHPDDMSSIILKSYHRYKNNIDVKLEEQFEHYIMYWLSEKEKEKRIRKTKLNNIDNEKIF